LQKILKWLRGMNFCINGTSSPRFAPSFMQLRNDPKCTQTLWIVPKHEFRVQWGGFGCIRCEKSRRDFVARMFALIALVHPILHRVSCSYETIRNAPKHYERLQNMSLGSNGVDQVRLLGKITTWLRGTNFGINCTSSVCFAPSFMQLRNNPKCTQILQNILKHYFMVQWGG
jgi:DNA polymerase III psi subunit